MPRSKLRVGALFEWEEAAHWAGYKWEEFQELDGEEQSRIVAHYRTHFQIDAVLEQERIKAIKVAQRHQGK